MIVVQSKSFLTRKKYKNFKKYTYFGEIECLY